MSSVLLLIAEFYPYQNATANCLINICRRLKEIDETLSFNVLCFKTNADDPDESVYDIFYIKRINKLPLINKKSYFDSLKKSKSPFFIKIVKKVFFLVKKIAYRSLERISSRPWRFGYKGFYRAINTLDGINKYGHIIAVSGNYSIAYSGALYKKKSKLPMSYTTYLTDPLLDNPLFNRKNNKKLREDFAFICDVSDKLVVTPIIMNNLQNKEKAISIEFPSFFENECYTSDQTNVNFDKNKINILYTGTFYPKIRDPEYLFKLIEKLDNRFVLHICGTISPHYINKHVSLINLGKLVIHDNLPHQQLFNAINDCDFLVNIGNSTNTMLPSKLVSYISTGKPIINIVKIKSCPTLTYLKDYPDYINLYEFQPVEMSLDSLNVYLNKKHEIISRDYIFARYSHCTQKTISNNFYNHVFKNYN